ncbi:unnamed protein product [Chilo suppressalis]|uniref:non-specific protein-tyrosine kinase n=1 Tax=Chilo suppressalis TaxID=168631 RepID=A0ABN8L7Y1_CHISP|nr:unnamed protein product [Chilo suppressalis]
MESIIDDRENLNEFLEEAELQQYYELFRDILKVTKVSQLKFVVIEDLAQIGLSKPEQRRYKKIYAKYFPNPYISKIKKLLSSNKRNDLNSHAHCSVPLEYQPFSENNVKVPTKHIISIEDITINKELGMGQFGVVQQGNWSTGNQRLQVAIKCLGHERMTSNSTEFLKEAAVMHSIEHPNIVRLYGVVLHLDSLMLVTELAPLRSLLECLREVTLRPNFPVPNLCEFAEQICDGMTYLENKRLIHRDLAARNILVFSKDRVKISDFGLSRALGVGKDYYQTNYNVNLKLPVAWCAPECILYLRFTSASDVWAFGVCLWEMFTYGFQPWAAFSGQQILEAIDAPNFQRLERPECCPEAYYTTMLECWSHNPNDRPKFRELGSKLREFRPEQVQFVANYQKPEDGRRSNFLEYKSGDIITVLGKEEMTKTSMWYGVLPGGACGVFDPSQTKPYSKHDPPRQIVAPYRPSEDLEQVPLINPNSPSHFTAATCTPPYPMLSPQEDKPFCDEVDLPCPETRIKSLKRPSHRTSEPTTSKSILNKVKSATLGRSSKNENGASNTDEVHEYHEISDTDTESIATENARLENLAPPESPGIAKTYGDFSQSLLEEMESLFRSMDGRKRDEAGAVSKNYDVDTSRSHTLSKSERKKSLQTSTGTMKPMSAHDEKTLEIACAMANELTTRSMDLESENKGPNSPNDRSKFHFKFPSISSHNALPLEPEKEVAGRERRNFSEEAHRVPDIQATITEECKLAYSSLIEQPTPTSTLIITQIPNDVTGIHKPGTIPKPAPRVNPAKQFHSLQKMYSSRKPTSEVDGFQTLPYELKNELPLPPRASKPKLIDKPRHIRKYPLKLPNNVQQQATRPPNPQPIIYQNAVTCPKVKESQKDTRFDADKNGVDVFDGAGPSKVDTNPFTNLAGGGSVNPFSCYLKDDKRPETADENPETEEETLVRDCTDHVSVEDLLEFADQKPCGRQRGVESDEVRIMSKVLKQQVTPEECLKALELSNWNVHQAIKVVRVRLSVERDVGFALCCHELEIAGGDIVKAAAALVLKTEE